MKKIGSLKNNIFVFILGCISTVSITTLAATIYFSDKVSYTPSDKKWKVDNVKTALDELYSKVEANYTKGFDDGKNSALGNLYGASTSKNTFPDYSVSSGVSGGDNRWATDSKSGEYSKSIDLYKNDSGNAGLLNVINMAISISTNSQSSGCSASDSSGTKGSASASYSVKTDTGFVLTSGSLSSGSKMITLNLFDYNLGEGATKLIITVNCYASANLAGSTCSYRAASGSVTINNVYATYLNV